MANNIRENRIGETRKMNNGMDATIIEYSKHRDMTIQFADGTIVPHVCYGNFERGTISNPNIKKSTKQGNKSKEHAKERLGEKMIAKNGMEMEIIEYFSQRNITVRFADGFIAKNVRYDHFKTGTVKNENVDVVRNAMLSKRIGESKVIKNEKVTIITYIDKTDVTVRWEDGTEKKVSYDSFSKGTIKKPFTDKDYIGKRGYTNGNNEEMTIIAATSPKDITVQFSDGTIVENVTYRQFKDGSVINPNNLEGRSGGNRVWATHIGEEGISARGQKMTIISYRKASDIDVEFENGVKVFHKSYSSFKKGEILNPGYHVGRTYPQTNGLSPIVIWQDKAKCRIKWEDNVEQEVITGQVVGGSVSHPTLKGRQNGSFAGFLTKQIAFTDEGKVYYPCVCKKCQMKDILTPQEMLEHEKSCIINVIS